MALLTTVPEPADSADVVSTSRVDIFSMRGVGLIDGWAASRQQVFRTRNAGRDWTETTPRGFRFTTINTMAFLDGRHAWAVVSGAPDSGSYSTLRTTDGGVTWSGSTLVDTLLDGSVPTTIEFSDPQHGWVVLRAPSNSNFRYGALLQTVNGGTTWTKLPPPPTIDRIHFVSPALGWIAGGANGDELYRTADAGLSWTRQQLSDPTGATDTRPMYHLPFFHNETEGTLPVAYVDRRGASHLVINTTHDAGQTWTAARSMPVSGTIDADNWNASVADSDTTVIAPPNLDEFTIVTSNSLQHNRHLPGNLPHGAAISAMEFSDAEHGWILASRGICDRFKSDCRQERRLYRTDDGAQTLFDITPQSTAPALDRGGTVVTDSVSISHNKKGFDKCAAGTVSQMQSWWTSTPWSDVNIYIGGSNRACGQTNLNSAWVSSIFAQGWHLIPTWVGPQAPGSGCGSCGAMSTNVVTARLQGIQEADLAIAAARLLQMQEPTVIYYDMEGYSPNSDLAVRSFLDGWTARLHELGNTSGVYGAGRNANADWAVIDNPPDAVWIAAWNGQQSVFGITGLPDTLWPNQQRIHQYQGGHDETWGGVTFNIDSNYEDGPVAALDRIFMSGFE